MIKKLRKKFIRIAMLAVTSVLLLLCITVNAANFISVNSQLNEMLSVIELNQGMLPPMPRGDKPPDGDGKKPKPDGQFTQETAYSTRYFVLKFTSDGQLVRADLDKIAAVTQDDTDEYVQIALKHGEGFGYTSGYKYYVTGDGDGRYTAIFLDCYRDVRAMITLRSRHGDKHCAGLCYSRALLAQGYRPGGQERRATEAVHNRREPRAENADNRYRNEP